jgi:NTP pyrophosphatase (non-canonical NTP hydrolase)
MNDTWNNWWSYLQLPSRDIFKPELVGFPFEEDDRMNLNINKESYEEIIQNLVKALRVMDDKNFQKTIDEDEKLQDIYGTLNDMINRLEKIQRDTKLKERNEELIDKCLDIECNFGRKTNTDPLSVLIKDYRESNKLDIHDTIENLIKAINVEAGELLETSNFGKVIDPKKVEEELADVLIYCFSLASELNIPVDRIIARKIKKNIERGRQYD